MQRVEIRDAIDAEHDGLAVDDELLDGFFSAASASRAEGCPPSRATATSASHGPAYAGGFSVTNDGNMCYYPVVFCSEQPARCPMREPRDRDETARFHDGAGNGGGSPLDFTRPAADTDDRFSQHALA